MSEASASTDQISALTLAPSTNGDTSIIKVESLLPQGIRVFGLRQARYIGLAKTRLQHIVTDAAMNLSRMWARGRNIPIGLTRVSRFLCSF